MRGRKAANHEEISERFWNRVDKSGDCWLWMGSLNPQGYGVFSYKGKSMGAYRVSWILTHGEITPDEYGWTFRKVVCHKCKNKSCVNPEHLYLGTHGTNAMDLVRSGKAPNKNYEENRYRWEFGTLSATTYFDYDKPEETTLLDWLYNLPEGEFSKKTKEYWKKKMKEDKPK